MSALTLAQAAAATPFPGYDQWWELGNRFTRFMLDSIVTEWQQLAKNGAGLAAVEAFYAEYLGTVYRRRGALGSVAGWIDSPADAVIYSGEFDSLSYAFYRSAFEALAMQHSGPAALEQARRAFTRRVGTAFYMRLQEHLHLDLPEKLESPGQLNSLKGCLGKIGLFLKDQGYVRDHFGFRFILGEKPFEAGIRQNEAQFLEKLQNAQTGHAIYEMGYPVILPSAVYLYQTIGEAQHHSSRTIEALFSRVGCRASESDDFDPGAFSPEQVVELWNIRRLPDGSNIP